LLSASLSPCCRYHPAGVEYRVSQPTTLDAAFTLTVAGSASGATHFRGHLCVRLRCGPVTCGHPYDGVVDGLQVIGFPPPCHPSYEASGSCLGGTNSRKTRPAFTGRTTGDESVVVVLRKVGFSNHGATSRRGFSLRTSACDIEENREHRKFHGIAHFSRVDTEGSGLATRRNRLNPRVAEGDCARRYLGTDPAIASSVDMNEDLGAYDFSYGADDKSSSHDRRQSGRMACSQKDLRHSREVLPPRFGMQIVLCKGANASENRRVWVTGRT
jgi:hypothetical protein